MRMQRLYWKFFVSFWVALVLFAGTSLLVTAHYLDRLREQQDTRAPRDHYRDRIAEARTIARQQGIAGLQTWAREVDSQDAVPLLLLDDAGHDLLDRKVPASVLDHWRRHRFSGEELREGEHPYLDPLVTLADGRRFYIAADFQGVTLGRILVRPRVIAVPLLLGTLISALVCYLLARYLTAPIERLRRASEAYAAGDLSHRVGPSMGARRDEIVDLALAFDHMAERLNDLMLSHKQLLRDVSHELRSPLARLQAALGLARQRSATVIQPELDRIEREADRLNELIAQLLSLARLEADARATPPELIDLADMLATISDDAGLECGARNCRLQIDIAGALPVRGDSRLLHSALENVVRNAIRYTAPDTRVEIVAGVREAGDKRVLIAVSDHGPGVAPHLLPRIFEPFVRVDEARDRSGGGYGLGLAIAKRAVLLHGGDIVAANAAAGGLCVTISLPAATAPDNPDRAAEPPAHRTSAP